MSDRAKPYINPYLAGTVLGIVLFLALSLIHISEPTRPSP